MKRLLGILIAVVMLFAVVAVAAACETDVEVTVALVTDVGDITDQSFNQTTWEAVKDYCEENKIGYKYYRPSEDSTDKRVEKMEQAAAEGAQIIVCPGYLFEEAIYQVQDADAFKNVKFLLLDGEPHDADYKYKTSANVHCILFQEEQAGYLAGYAAVKDGETKLGFLGGMAVPAVQRFGFGYIQGIQDAAAELNANVDVWYAYGGQFFGDATITSVMDGWYANGIDTIFACGGGIYTSVADAILNSSNANAKLIGVDTDQKGAIHSNDTYKNIKVLTSAMKGLYDATQTTLKTFFAGQWDTIGGKTANLGLINDGNFEYVGLPTATESWDFATFTVAEYNAIVAKIRNGSVTISNDVTTDIEAWIKNASNLTFKAYNGKIK